MSYFPSLFQEYIYKSRYARFLHEENRREEWPETVKRYFDFFTIHLKERNDYSLSKDLRIELQNSVLNLETMPSMRCLMTAGPALAKSEVAGYNCSYISVDSPKCFAELLYILMCGTGVGFSVERQYVNKMPEVPTELYPTDTTIVVLDSKLGWAKALNELISLLYTGHVPKWDLSKLRAAGTVLKTFGGRCLTGDTIVYKDRKKSRGYNEITIKQLFDIQERERSGMYRGRFKKIKLRSLDEKTGEFFRNQLIEVIDNGIQPVYQIVTKNGYRIKATGNHRFMNAVGEYNIVDNFDIGDMVAVNGAIELKTGVCVDCKTSISRRSMRCKLCFDETQKKENCSEITVRQRKEVKSYKKQHLTCELCGKVGELECHHIDGNPRNNDWSNLQVLCIPCHRQEDMKRIYFGNPYACKYMMYDEIIEISEVGLEQTYDLVMEGPNHNFVANGFVSHNSSGPAPLDKLFKFLVSIFQANKGGKLSSLDCHDICCMIGNCVVVGGVRRSALISLSNLSDDRMRNAKMGQWWNLTPYRSISNNSAVYTDKTPSMEIFMHEWKSLYDSKSGERGIFSRYAARNVIERSNQFRKTHFGENKNTRYRDVDGYEFGCNPCSEILLRPNEFCNLTEVVVRPHDDVDSLKRKCRIAAILGTFQSTLTDFKFLSKKWKDNTEEERLLGVSLTGIMDNKVLSGQSGEEKLKDWLTEMRKEVIAVNLEFSKKMGIPASVASTCVKPSGTVSSLVDTASGIHRRHAPFYLRTVRGDKKDPLAQMMVKQGFPVEDDQVNPDHNHVFTFPIKSNKNALFREDDTAIKQLEIWLLYQKYWTDHKPSITVSVKDHEWMKVGSWCYDNFEWLSGVSFLPYSDHSYVQAPFQEVTEEVYKEWVAKMPKEVQWEELKKFETHDETTGAQELACVAGCEIS